MRRAAPGPQLARGRVRVDAARAIAKLREYQLVDKTAWVLEAIRAAVASGATRVELRGDTNDVWLSWDGPAWPAEDLPRLFDELVSPEATAERHHLRLLASGVNSALGMDPAYIDVIAIAGDGGAVRARFVPGLLEEAPGGGGATGLRELVAEDVAAPAGVAPGMLVHLRRRASLGLMSILWEREPPELPLARAACEDLPVPLHVGRDVHGRDRPRRDVLREPFELGDASGYLALVDGLGHPDTELRVEVAERGVALSRYQLDSDLAPVDARVPVPLRLFVDAPRMPTNASRSQVRREQHPIAAAEARARPLLTALVKRATAAMVANPGDERLRGAVVALLAVVVGGPSWRTNAQTITSQLRELAKLPLLRTATNGRRALLDSWSWSVHTGKDPFPAELERWLGDVLWVPPGDPAALLIVGTVVDSGEMRRIATWARAQRRADRSFFAHAPRAAVVTSPSRDVRMRAPLGARIRESVVPPAWFDKLTGEVCVYGERTGGELVVLFHGRELDRLAFESPIGFAAVIDSTELTPAERYRGVVKSDASYARVERAMRAGVLCLVEAIALEQLGAAPPDGFTASSSGAQDPRLIREGLGLVGELGLWTKYPIADVPLWPTVGGAAASITEISAHEVISVVGPGASIAPPAGRLAIVADARERARLTAAFTKVRFIHYDDARSRRASALELARTLAKRTNALAITDGSLVGAIALAPTRSMLLHHVGYVLSERPYTGSVVSCTISVDSEDLVPTSDWRGVTDDAGLGRRDFSAWEIELLRAGARALIGERVPELVGSEVVSLASTLGQAVIASLAVFDPITVLGEELLARLRAAPLARLLGTTQPCSIDDVARALPGTVLPYVETDVEPLAGFEALAAGRTFAAAAARVLGRTARDVGPEVVHRRRAAAREVRHTQHRERPVRAIALEGHSVALELRGRVTGSGLVALGTAGLDIMILVEQRMFWHVTRASGLPLRAIVDLDATHVDADFVTLAPGLIDLVIEAVESSALRVVTAHVADDPRKLADPGPVHDLAVKATVNGAVPAELRTAEAFLTIHGPRISIERALASRSRIAVATWHGDYLPPPAGTAPHPCDEGVIDSAHQIRRLLEQISGLPVDDVSRDVERLQARRSMERGLVPAPTVPIASSLKCALADLGPDGEQLGPGEIGLTDEAQTQMLVHAHGRVVRTSVLAVRPPVKVALDEKQLPPVDPFDLVAAQLRALTLTDAGHISLDARIQDLALRLVRRLAAQPDALTPGVRARLRDALLGRFLTLGDVGPLALFETLAGTWVAWSALEGQIARYGNLWSVPRTEAPSPIDPDRIVLVLDTVDRGRLTESGIAVIDATKELELDALAERNRARPIATNLDLGSREGVLAEVRLDEAGRRGTVALLAPSAASRRGLWAHREMFPFDVANDPCRWPTLAYVDDARLSPDRTWSQAANDDAWREFVVAVRRASGHLLGQLVAVPEDALATFTVEPHTLARVAPGGSETAIVVGKLWLTGEPYAPHAVRVVGAYGVNMHVPTDGAAIGGVLYAYTPHGWDPESIDKLCAAAHGELVRSLLRFAGAGHSELVAAHALHALALKRILPAEARSVRPPCIAPLDAMQFFTAVGKLPVRVRAADTTPGRDEPSIGYDGSLAARTLIAALGDHVRRDPVGMPARANVAAAVPEPPRRPHPLDPLAERLEARLRQIGVGLLPVRIAHRAEPLLRHAHAGLQLAGDSARLAAVANACTANSPWAAACVDALAAHALTVLDVALTPLTEAAQLHAIGALLLES